MKPLTYPEIAATVLAEIRAIYPTGRKPDPEITEAWARVIARAHLQVPAAVWREAVTVWSVSNSEPPAPHDMIDAAKQVIAQWETIPERREQLNEFRRQVLQAKFGDAYGAHDALQGAEQKELTSGQDRVSWRELKAGIARRSGGAQAAGTKHVRSR